LNSAGKVFDGLAIKYDSLWPVLQCRDDIELINMVGSWRIEPSDVLIGCVVVSRFWLMLFKNSALS
jgi:hypothetical protein